MGFAPHTRGSTYSKGTVLILKEVCPAHAGVYPVHVGGTGYTSGLPRTRGGLPPLHLEAETPAQFAPHTRGSTLAPHPVPAPRYVCPAHAGVYRYRAGERRHERKFAPHTRGSTDQIPRYERQGGVCPAHAGVYPQPFRSQPNPGCLPRTRGGLPPNLSQKPRLLAFAPHTRGSTQCISAS